YGRKCPMQRVDHADRELQDSGLRDGLFSARSSLGSQAMRSPPVPMVRRIWEVQKRWQPTLVVAVVGVLIQASSFSWSASAADRSPAGGIMSQLAGHWTSEQHVTFTNPSRAGSSFYLDIVVAEDGTFQGSWDAYSCSSYATAYGAIISCV